MFVEIADFRAMDIQSQHQHRKKTTARAERCHYFEVIGRITASPDLRLALLADGPQLDESLDQRKTQKNEHRKHQQPERILNLGGLMAGNQADGVKSGQAKYIEQGYLFQTQGIGPC